VLAVGHTLVVTVRRRHREFAMLKVLGLRPRQIASSIAWQATLIVGSGLLLGVPLGLAAGVWSWSTVTSAMGLDNRPDVPLGAVAATIVLAVVLANVVALAPARRAARTRPATALRVE
jgi:putative ABC transport system permease protein